MIRFLILLLLLACGGARAQTVLVAGANSVANTSGANVFLVKTNSGLKLYSLYLWNGTNSGHHVLLFDTNATPGTAAVPSFPPVFLPPLTNVLITFPGGCNFRQGLVIATSTTAPALTNSSPIGINAAFYDRAY